MNASVGKGNKLDVTRIVSKLDDTINQVSLNTCILGMNAFNHVLGKTISKVDAKDILNL